ncbi:MAG TPA: hypothetical protein VHK67_02025 [Rhabdochlamydiaceae bacterium]|jgi:hypothetical protein|nr:hypothetical protein [Rhabdochlamydiaceae bacterium]
MTVPRSTEGPNEGPGFEAQSNKDEALLPKIPASSLPRGDNAEWLRNYYNALYPNGPAPTDKDLVLLNRAICGMINSYQSERNTAYQQAQQYVKDVAKGQE